MEAGTKRTMFSTPEKEAVFSRQILEVLRRFENQKAHEIHTQLSALFYRWETAERRGEVGPAIPTVRLAPSGCSLCRRCTVERIRSLVST